MTMMLPMLWMFPFVWILPFLLCCWRLLLTDELLLLHVKSLSVTTRARGTCESREEKTSWETEISTTGSITRGRVRSCCYRHGLFHSNSDCRTRHRHHHRHPHRHHRCPVRTQVALQRDLANLKQSSKLASVVFDDVFSDVMYSVSTCLVAAGPCWGVVEVWLRCSSGWRPWRRWWRAHIVWQNRNSAHLVHRKGGLYDLENKFSCDAI
jgi:hypothetical protein